MWPLLTPTIISVWTDNSRKKKLSVWFSLVCRWLDTLHTLLFTPHDDQPNMNENATLHERYRSPMFFVNMHVEITLSGSFKSARRKNYIFTMTCSSSLIEATVVLLLSHHGIQAVQQNVFWRTTPWIEYSYKYICTAKPRVSQRQQNCKLSKKTQTKKVL